MSDRPSSIRAKSPETSLLPPTASDGKPTGKTIYLIASMTGWMLVGGALIYLAPVLANRLFHSETTELWMTTLNRGGYNPMISVIGGSIALVATIIGNVVWSKQFGQTR